MFNREPILWIGLVEAAVAAVSSFGLELTQKQIGAVMLLTVAILSFWKRSQVSPVAKAAK